MPIIVSRDSRGESTLFPDTWRGTAIVIKDTDIASVIERLPISEIGRTAINYNYYN